MTVTQVVKGAVSSWISTKLSEARYRSRRWTVLCLHRVIAPDAFKALLDRAQESYRLVSLSEGFDSIRSGPLGRPLLTLTFDDADKTIWQNCLPELRKRSAPACLFVCTGFVEAGCVHSSTLRFDVMTWDDLKDWVEAGLEVGAHTVNHIPLNQATLDRCKWEILESKRRLEDRLSREVSHFAYPWGYYTDELDEWLQEDNAFRTISTTIARDNYPSDRGKSVHRKPPPCDDQNRGIKLRNQTLYEEVRAAHQRSILNGLAPVVWRMSGREPKGPEDPIL